MKKIILILIYLLPFVLYSQDIQRVRETIDSLTAPRMHGRGAENNGEAIAAKFIRNKFSVLGLSAFQGSFYQRFTYDINTFPNKVALQIGKKELCPGKDFILNGASGSGKGTAPLVFLDSLQLANKTLYNRLLKKAFAGKAIVIPEAIEKQTLNNEALIAKLKEAAAILVLKHKLTGGLASFQTPFVYFEVLDQAFPPNAKKIHFNVDAQVKENFEANNVIGYIPGSVNKDSIIVISAHYDHLGQMGANVYFPGANDNASGISMLLEFAHYFTENPPPYSIAFMAFGAEEAGLVGSHYYVENPLFPLEKIKFLINLDLVGTGDEGIMVVNGVVLPRQFELLSQINAIQKYVPAVKKRGEAANSDHYFFYKNGVPSFFIYTLGGIKAYHDIYDRPETLPLTKYKGVFQLIVRFIHKLEVQ